MFWLGGELQITPQEQIQFLKRLHSNDLPFSEKTIAIVKDIMIVEQTPDYRIRAKTGWAGASHICRSICRGEAFGQKNDDRRRQIIAPNASPTAIVRCTRLG